MQRVYDKAAARWEPYSKIDMLVASKQLDTEEFAALRQEAQAAFEDFRFITQEADEFVKNANEQRQASLKTQAKEAVEVLKKAIPGWNQAMYDSVRKYAIDSGFPAEIVNEMVNPVAIQMWHKAMTFDKAKTITTKKKTVQPKKVLKTTKTTTGRDVKEDRAAAQMKRLKASGTTDDAADLFLARWAQD
jgi:Zn-dependent metalloprotease